MVHIIETDMKVKIPGAGTLYAFQLVKTEDYPSIGIFFSENGVNVDRNNLVLTTEYNSTFEIIQTVGFKKDSDDYVAAIRFEDGDIIQD